MYDPKNVDVASEEFLKADYIILANIKHEEYDSTLEAFLHYHAQKNAAEETGDEDFGHVYLIVFDKEIKLLDRQGDPLDIIKAALVIEASDGNIKSETFDNVGDAKELFEKYEAKYLTHIQEE